MKILVCGHDYADKAYLERVLDGIHVHANISHLIHSKTRGAGVLAGEWAQARGIITHVFHAHWDRDGKAAAALCDTRMIERGKPDLVVAFPGDHRTEKTIDLARKAGVEVRRV